MNELTFNRISQPVKFRRLKLWRKDTRYVIKYILYNVLNKLHILGRYTYTSMGEDYGTKYPNPARIDTSLFSATVEGRLYKEEYEVIDYFFTKKSLKGDNTPNNVKKVILNVENDSYRCTHFLELRLIDHCVKLSGNSYSISNFPTVKAYPVFDSLTPASPKIVQNGNTIHYDFNDLCRLCVNNVVSSDDINSEEIKHYYEYGCKVLEDMLESKKLSDFQRS